MKCDICGKRIWLWQDIALWDERLYHRGCFIKAFIKALGMAEVGK